MNKWYTEYSEFLRRLFPEHKMQKISVNAGFSCPNRDGTWAQAAAYIVITAPFHRPIATATAACQHN